MRRPWCILRLGQYSLIDFQTYANVFAHEKMPFDVIRSSERAGMPFYCKMSCTFSSRRRCWSLPLIKFVNKPIAS